MKKSELKQLIREEISNILKENNGKKLILKKGLTVLIKPADIIDKLNFSDDYKKYLKQIAGKKVTIKRAFRDPINRGFGPLNQFEVEGYLLWNKRGFDSVIIQQIL